MKNLKRIILMISMFAIVGTSVNCSFRKKLESRSARLNAEISNHQRSGLSVMLSKISRNAKLMLNRVIPGSMKLPIQQDPNDRPSRDSIQLSVNGRRNILKANSELSEFCELTQEDSDKVRSILSFRHENQDKFSDCFLDFIDDYFTGSDDFLVFVDKNKIKRYLIEIVSFSDLRTIYADSVLSDIKFIRNIFEQEIFFDITFEYYPELNMQIPFSILLKFDIFEGLWDLCIKENSFPFPFDYELSEDIRSLFVTMIEGGLEDIQKPEPGNSYHFLMINLNFILDCFIRDMVNKGLGFREALILFLEQNIENMDLWFIEAFIKFVEQNVEKNEAEEILNRGLEISNPEYSGIITRRLEDIDCVMINLDSLGITEKQLCFIIPRLEQFRDLRAIFLDKNLLKKLPKSIGNLENLKYLHLNYNQLTEFYVGIGKFTNLVDLYLKNNQLKEFYVEYRELRNLKCLVLSGNQLTKFPESIVNLTNIEILGLGGTNITRLPVEIREFIRLEYFSIPDDLMGDFNSIYAGRERVQDFINSYFDRSVFTFLHGF